MTCEHCGASLRADWDKGVFVCDYCGSEFVPPAESDGVLVLGESSALCPICASRLSEGKLEAHPLKYCVKCHGMLIPMDAVVALVDTLRARRNWFAAPIEPCRLSDRDRHFHCPICNAGMDAHPYGGGGNVNVDTCERCGLLWLDGGELLKIVTAPQHESRIVACEDDDQAELGSAIF